MPEPAPHPFVVIHVNGIHYVSMYFCKCGHMCSTNLTDQLLAVGWYPATITFPKTCATFQLLHHCHLQTLQSKQLLINFYMALECETNNTGIVSIRVRSLLPTSVPDSWVKKKCYVPFLRMFRQWKYLLLLKQSGQGHQDGLTAMTKSGDLVILCP